MATWEDGPEYAPVERPDEFRLPDVPPLSAAPPHAQPAALAPVERPRFTNPPEPVRPLAELVPAPAESRDPSIPYQVASSTLTAPSASAWAAAHWSGPTPASAASPTPAAGQATPPALAPAFAPAPGPALPPAPGPGSAPEFPGWAPPVGASGWSPPAGAPWAAPPAGYPLPPPTTPFPAPTSPFPPPGGPPSSPTGLPVPGTQQWFAPGHYAPPPEPPPSAARRVVDGLTPGLLITLVIGGFIAVVAPITLVIAWALSSRVRLAQPAVRLACGLGVSAVLGLGLLRALAGGLDYVLWWDAVSQTARLASWLVLVAIVIIAARGLRSGPPPGGSSWS